MVINFDITIFHCVIKNKHLPSLFASFFCSHQFYQNDNLHHTIHQPITFVYFELQPITDKWAEHVALAHARAGTTETIHGRGKLIFLRLWSAFRQTILK